MKMIKVAVIIADSYGEPFESIRTKMQPTLWQFENHPDVFYVKGNAPRAVQRRLNQFTDSMRYSRLWPIQRLFDRIEIGIKSKRTTAVKPLGDELLLDIPEGLRYLGLKVLKTLDYLHGQGYEVVYKTTLSSIVNHRNFLNEIATIEQTSPFYGGTLINFGKHPFVSGANLMLNRKTIEIILSSKKDWDYGLLDDVSIGRLLEGKVEIHEITTINISTLDQLKNLTDEELTKTTHFRCKSSSVNRNDIQIMNELKKRLSI
jgi:hypothetical protein